MAQNTSRAADVSDHLRAQFEELGEAVVAQIVGRPYTHAAGQTPGVPAWAADENARRHALSWLREKRRREKFKVWIGWGVGWVLSLIVIGIAIYNLCLTMRADRPELVSTDARLFINSQASPRELLRISWGNMGKRSALRGTAALFTVTENGSRREKFGYSEIAADTLGGRTTLTPTFGYGYAQVSVDMSKFAGLFLVCVKYYDETNRSYRQKFLFKLGAKLEETVTKLDELPLYRFSHISCK